MINELAKLALDNARIIQQEANQLWLLPADNVSSRHEMVIANSLVKRTRGYIESVANQINSTYENACYDACAVMIRRLVETLIIEVFEHFNIANKIKTSTGDFPYLSDLITFTLNETSWNLTRNTKQALPKLKNIGDLSAHSRRYNAHRSDIDNIRNDLRTVVQELIYLASLQR